MTIFRSKKNGKLYNIYKKYGHYAGFYAIPYCHSTPAFPRKKTVTLNEFTVVAER